MLAEVKHRLTLDELRDLGDRLARRIAEIERLRGELKAVGTAIKAGIEAATGEAQACARKINNGWEMREVECSVFYHTPRNGIKTIMPADQCDEPREEPMTPADLQQGLAFGDKGQ